MARKTKENLEELDKNVKKVTKRKTTKTAEKSTPAVKSVAKKEAKITAKKTAEKKATSKKETKTSTKKAATKNATPKKETKTSTEKATAKKTTTKNETKSVAKKASTKKASTKEVSKTSAKKASTKKETKTATKKATTKKATTKKETKSATKKATTKKATKTSKATIINLNVTEYYDLPYRYNKTDVKVLAQNPNTLFVYWDIADSDREYFEQNYGKLFFFNTRPVLVVHNLTENYTFEIDIDDFANNWYIHVDDAKCKYVVELGRRPKYEEHQDVPVNYLNVAFSNAVEIPNDHIIFFKDNDRIYFKNIKTNKVTEKIFNNKLDSNKVKHIYKDYNLSDDRFDFRNPFSQNPTSNV